ncbi:4Fe-4S ferredoxin [bacterium]|nr:4Fe-4S ferredoxin [bacterium]
MDVRTIVEIDEALCNGCGDCIPNCVEGALKIVDGKAKLVSDVLCDGFGACLGHCPQDAIRMVEREADEYNEAAVEANHRSGSLALGQSAIRRKAQGSPHVFGPAPMCPGSMARNLKSPSSPPTVQDPEPQLVRQDSQLSSWPVQLHLLNPMAPFLPGSDLLLCADCVPFALPNFHQDYLKDRIVAIGCPKLDNVAPYLDKLTAMLQRDVRSLTVLHMEVPCCGGIVNLAVQAWKGANVNIPLRAIQVSIRGEILADESYGPVTQHGAA